MGDILLKLLGLALIGITFALFGLIFGYVIVGSHLAEQHWFFFVRLAHPLGTAVVLGGATMVAAWSRLEFGVDALRDAMLRFLCAVVLLCVVFVLVIAPLAWLASLVATNQTSAAGAGFGTAVVLLVLAWHGILQLAWGVPEIRPRTETKHLWGVQAVDFKEASRRARDAVGRSAGIPSPTLKRRGLTWLPWALVAGLVAALLYIGGMKRTGATTDTEGKKGAASETRRSPAAPPHEKSRAKEKVGPKGNVAEKEAQPLEPKPQVPQEIQVVIKTPTPAERNKERLDAIDQELRELKRDEAKYTRSYVEARRRQLQQEKGRLTAGR